MGLEAHFVMSTAHVPTEVGKWLDKAAEATFNPAGFGAQYPMWVADTGHGWFMPALQGIEVSGKVPLHLVALLAFTRHMGAAYLLLDSGGPVTPHLPVYEW